MSESLNHDTFAQLVRAIAEGRHKSESDVRALIDDGPFLPKNALDAGLVDGVAYEDELDDLVPVLRRGGEAVDWIETDEYSAGTDGVRLRRRPRIAVLYAVGTIVSGRGGFDPTDGELVGSDTLIEDIRRIRDDRSIRGIVLRIDSPGGSSVASDVILRELQLTKKDDPSRPIVVSMSDLAASGGYYIALAGDEIVAQPGTLTGSIGIYTGKIVYGGTLEKVGVERRSRHVGRQRRHLLAADDVHAGAARQGGSLHTRLLHRLPRQDRGVAPQDARRRCTRSRRAACGPARRRRRTVSSTGWADSTSRLRP